MKALSLQGFDTYLSQRRLVPERQRPYLVRWVRRFLQGPGGDQGLSQGDQKRLFQETLDGDPHLEDWHRRQAMQAGELHLDQYLRWSEAKGQHEDSARGSGRERIVQMAMRQAVARSGIPKAANLHTLRHSFATHLLMRGVNIREVQRLLGHKTFETTMVYLHVIRNLQSTPVSPPNTLKLKGGDLEEEPQHL